MNRLFPLAMLAMAPLVQARFGRLQDRRDSNECCPCPAPGAPSQGVTTVTVTQPAAAPKTETVTILQTVTPSGATVTITQINNNPPAVTQEVTVQLQPKPQTVTVINGPLQPSHGTPAEGSQPRVTTKTTQQGGTPQEGPKTVTITNGPSPTPGSPNVVTVTVNPNPSSPAGSSQPGSPPQPFESPSRPNSGDTVVTKTLSNVGNPETGPNVKAVASPDPSVMTAPPVTVTASPQVQTVVESIYQTLTKTVSGSGGDNIEIIIINISTGESTCRKKHSGKPCNAENHSSVPLSTGAPCPSAMNTTSITTAYNTVVVTLGTGKPHNATSAMGAPFPTGAGNPMMTIKGRKPRGPLSERIW
ncbi:hypothetical protein TOPH_02871 [Tolypocladium ophioglossoides CBS 100239]|uniref:Uncharacterized protein n=1 Tax=Tolypocladium ophioglossoides (strain CBS 100239) TaxID=1163406 RepID=A0A0L0NFR9_TOLOC|nr:hypothetical protein TOPH_02871 [Tolypocladium ophioglossoides CBS 100239]